MCTLATVDSALSGGGSERLATGLGNRHLAVSACAGRNMSCGSFGCLSRCVFVRPLRLAEVAKARASGTISFKRVHSEVLGKSVGVPVGLIGEEARVPVAIQRTRCSVLVTLIRIRRGQQLSTGVRTRSRIYFVLVRDSNGITGGFVAPGFTQHRTVLSVTQQAAGPGNIRPIVNAAPLFRVPKNAVAGLLNSVEGGANAVVHTRKTVPRNCVLETEMRKQILSASFVSKDGSESLYPDSCEGSMQGVGEP